MKHINIPVFVPHLGCPEQCVFCDQRAISGVRSFHPAIAGRTIEEHLATLGDREAEIAFFGGSFTGIPKKTMLSLLDLAAEYVRAGRASGIRFSTRPDFIDEEILSLLAPYPVAAVELGIQSSSDRVLALSKRGHTAGDSERAMRLLREAGIPVVGQMMLGLPGSGPEQDRETARFLVKNGASDARIYPTVVFRGTELARMTEEGAYVPLTEEETVHRGADVLGILSDGGVGCIRIGLPETATADGEGYLAGPRCPAVGERIRSELYGRRISEALESAGPAAGCEIAVSVAPGEISAAVGYRRENKIRIENKYNVKKVKFIEKEGISRYNIEISAGLSAGEGGMASCI